MYKENLHERIKKARTEAGYSQQQVADELEFSQSRIAKIESGRQEPDVETLGKLAEFYAVSTDWLLGIGAKEPAMNVPPPAPKANLGNKIVSAASLYAFLATLPVRDKKSFLSGEMKFSQFTDSKYFQGLSSEQQIYLYQEYQSQQWIKDQEEAEQLSEPGVVSN